MASFPSSIAALTNPTSTNTLNSPSHSLQHSNANDEIEAIEGYLKNNPSSYWTNYTPTLTNFVCGSLNASYYQIANLVFVHITIPTPSSITGNWSITLPKVPAALSDVYSVNVALVGSITTQGLGVINITTGELEVSPLVISGSYLQQGTMASNVPFVWTSGTATVDLYYNTSESA